MAITYPTSLDTLTTGIGTTGQTLASPNHITQHNNESLAIQALEAKVGVNSSAVTTSHDYKLSGVTGSDKAVSKTGVEVLTNKTLTTPVITTPTFTLGSDATGDIWYRHSDGTMKRLGIGTAAQVLNVTSGVPAWRDETSVVNASTTVKGVVELATAAEITAGTATGATGAALVMTPDQFALSTPVFNGSGITSLTRKSMLGRNVPITGSAGNIRYIQIVGSETNGVTPEPFGTIIPFSGTLRNLYIRSGGTLSSTSTVYVVRKNGTTNTALTISFTSGQTNTTKSDTSNTASVSAGDYITIEETSTGTGNPIINAISIELDHT